MLKRRPILFPALALVLILSASASYATSARATVNGNVSKFFGFTMPADGGAEITLTWNQNHADLFVIMACGAGADALEYSSIATENRAVRLDAGLIGGLDCAIGIASFQRPGTYTMILSTTERGPGLRALSSGASELQLVEVTEAEAEVLGLKTIERKIRSLQRK